MKLRGSKVSRSILGAPVLSLVYRSVTVPARRVDGRVQAQLVDDRTGRVLGNQITPIKVRLDGKRHKVKTKLETIAATLKPGRSFTLQIVASSVAYAPQLATGTLRLAKMNLALPIADRKHRPPGYRRR